MVASGGVGAWFLLVGRMGAWWLLAGGWGHGWCWHGVQAVLVTAWHFTSLMLLKVRHSSLFHNFTLLEHDILKWTLYNSMPGY